MLAVGRYCQHISVMIITCVEPNSLYMTQQSKIVWVRESVSDVPCLGNVDLRVEDQLLLTKVLNFGVFSSSYNDRGLHIVIIERSWV